MEFGERVNTRVMATSGDDQGEPQRPDLLQYEIARTKLVEYEQNTVLYQPSPILQKIREGGSAKRGDAI